MMGEKKQLISSPAAENGILSNTDRRLVICDELFYGIMSPALVRTGKECGCGETRGSFTWDA